MALAKSVLIIVLLAGFLEIRVEAQNDVLKILSENNFSRFRKWLEPVKSFFAGGGDKTVFAFNDSTYNSLPLDQRTRLDRIDADQDLQRQYVMTYACVGVVQKSDLVSSSIGNSRTGYFLSANGNKVFTTEATIYSRGTVTTTGVTHTYVNGARIVGLPDTASNGLVYTLDRPPDLPSRENVYAWIMSNGDNSGIQTTRLRDLLSRLLRDYFQEAIAPLYSEQRVTFFMPSEAALSRIPAGKFDTISDSELANYFRMHFIPDRVIYTSFVNHQEKYPNGNANYENSNNDVVFMRNNNKVTVKSGQVVASVTQGNITVDNGVIHIIDTMFGFVYRTLLEQIKQDCPIFHGLLQGLDSNLNSWLAQGSANIFVPNDMAMNRIRSLVNYNSNRTLIDFIVRLSLLKEGSIQVSQLNGNYAVRQHRISRYRDWKIVVYNDRNETWVNAGHVRAKILKPDIKTTTGTMQIIDAVLGIPSMDIPHLIYYDDYLLWTYYDLRSVGLVEYLRDPRFDNSTLPPRTFNSNGYGMNPYQQTTRSPYPNSNYPGSNYPNNNYPTGNNNNYPTGNNNNYPTGNNNNYPTGNNYPNSNYPNQNSNYPNQYPNSNYPNQYPNQYKDPLTQPVANYGRCRNYANVCQFTYFVPNGSAIFNYKNTAYGRQISLNPNLYRYVLRRTLIMDRLVYLENMPINTRGTPYVTHTGDTITIAKENDNLARISWLSGGSSGGLVSARVIMWDLGATNGVVHIIENVLSVSSDLSIDPSGADYMKSSMVTVLFLCLLSCFYRLQY